MIEETDMTGSVQTSPITATDIGTETAMDHDDRATIEPGDQEYSDQEYSEQQYGAQQYGAQEADAFGEDSSGTGLSASSLGGLGWGVVVSVCLGVLLFAGGLLTARQSGDGAAPRADSAAGSASAAEATAEASPSAPDSASDSASDSTTTGRIDAPGRVVFDFEDSTQGWAVKSDGPAGGEVRHDTDSPLGDQGSLEARSATPNGQWISVALEPVADLSLYGNVSYSRSGRAAPPMLGLSGSWGWCQIDIAPVGPGRSNVSFDLRQGASPAGMECTTDRLATVTSMNLWVPPGRSSIDDIKISR